MPEYQTTTFDIGDENDTSDNTLIIFLTFCIVLFSFLATCYITSRNKSKKEETHDQSSQSEEDTSEEEKEDENREEKASMKTFLVNNLKYEEGRSVAVWYIADKYVEWCQREWKCKPEKYSTDELLPLLLEWGYQRVSFPGMKAIKDYHF
jgi:hypothetical protein